MPPPLRKPPPAPVGFDPHRLQTECDYWYQRWQVFEGVYTPGISAVEPMCARMGLPADLSGKRVLDIGAWNGCMSFECERRGADEVLALSPEDPRSSGFELLRQISGSTRVRYHAGSCYRLDPEEIGHFDVVLLCGVLYHLRYPLLGLDNVRRVCQGTLYVETHVSDIDLWRIDERLLSLPLWRFYRRDELFGDPSNWFGPTSQAVVEALESAGFAVDHMATSQPTRAVFRAAVRTGLPEFLSLRSIEGAFYNPISQSLLGPWKAWQTGQSNTARQQGEQQSMHLPKHAGKQVRQIDARLPASTRCLLIDAPRTSQQGDAIAADDAPAQMRLYRAFLPLLKRWAPVRELSAGRQSLTDAVRQARNEGLQPICVSFAPLCGLRLSREAPNVAFSAWPYPDLPSPALSGPTVGEPRPPLERLSLLVAGSRFTQSVFLPMGRESGVLTVAPPVADRFFELSAWLPGTSALWRGPAYAMQPGRGSTGGEPWLFPVAQRAELSGIVYTAVIDPADAASNWLLLVDTFIEALADRAGALLAVKLLAEDGRDQPHLARALQYYRNLARDHRCRVLLLPGEFAEEQSLMLTAASSFHVTATRAEGACAALASALAAGRPVISPRHTALADYVDGEVAFVVKSRPDPAQLSGVLRSALNTVWYEVNRRSLIEAFRASYEMAHKMNQYRQIGDKARKRMWEICSTAVVERQLFSALDRIS